MYTQLLKSTQIAGIAITLSFAQSAQATPTNIIDTYIGGNDHNYGDVIGSTANFDISCMDVEITGNILSISINTGFAGKADNHLFDSVTSGNGIGYGDLFLSSSWSPFGSAPYLDDDSSTGTVWEYGFSLDNRWMNEALAGSGTLYSLNSGDNDADALLSQDFLTGATFRDGQEIAVDTLNGDITAIAGSSSWNITEGKVNFLIDLTGTALASSDSIAMHWGMSCGNDTIEGQLLQTQTVPEPAIISLLIAGLASIGLGRRKRKST